MKKINISKKYIIGIVLVVLLVGGVFLGGKAVAWNKVKTNSIGLENAQNYALADSGIDPKKAQILKTKFDYEDEEFIYEVEFIYENVKYEYDIRAMDGTVLKKSLENINNKQSNTTIVSNISAEKARDIALNDLDFLLENVDILKMNLELYDNVPVYEIKFIANNKEYKYGINATNGNIYEKDIKALSSVNISNNQNINIDNNSKEITLDKAKEIVLKDAKLSIATFTKTKIDYDDGIKVYKIEFIHNNVEYEYEINASDGSIYSKESKSYNNGNIDNNSKEITLNKAKEIVLKDAKLSIATFTKTKIDYDDGIKVYKIEFIHNNVEYEYEINAITGAVISKEIERD